MLLSRFSGDICKAIDRRLGICYGIEYVLLQEVELSVLATWRSNKQVSWGERTFEETITLCLEVKFFFKLAAVQLQPTTIDRFPISLILHLIFQHLLGTCCFSIRPPFYINKGRNCCRKGLSQRFYSFTRHNKCKLLQYKNSGNVHRFTECQWSLNGSEDGAL
jgi:hypothetical protein